MSTPVAISSACSSCSGSSISLVTVIIAHLSWRGWVAGVRALFRGEGITQPFSQPAPSDMQPLASDLRVLLRELDMSRRGRDQSGTWSPELLRRTLRDQLLGDEIIVVSNREPFIHDRGDDGIVVQRPASGLVTALEPMMRACSGTWIAHGSGSADRETVDRTGPRAGAAREAELHAAPCLAHARRKSRATTTDSPTRDSGRCATSRTCARCFARQDWEQYKRVNRRFADVVLREARTEDPVVARPGLSLCAAAAHDP